MKTSIKTLIITKILFIIVLFYYVYPEHYTFLPCSTYLIIQILGFGYSILYFYRNKCSKYYVRLFTTGIIIAFTGLFSAYIFNRNGDFEVAKRGIQLILYICSSIFLVSLLNKCESNISIYKFLKYLICVTIIQAIISLVFFLIPETASRYRDLIVVNDAMMESMETLSGFRLVGIGDVKYATGAVQYGLMMWGVIALIKSNYSIFYTKKYISIILITLFTLCGIMSGRVYFLFLGVTIVYITYLDKSIKRGISDYLRILLPTFIILTVAFIYLLAEYEDLIKWAFELFINYSEGGSIESASTDQLKDMYIFPESIKTWLIGDGKSVDPSGGFYMHSDVGFIRSLYYWGIIGSIIYYGAQIYLYKIFKANSKSVVLNKYVCFIVIWLFIYSLKDFYSIEKLMILLIVTQIMANQYARKNKIHNCDTCIQTKFS